MALAFACDAAFGDPQWFPHPVRAIGSLCSVLERAARTWTRDEPRRELLAGAIVWATIVGGTFAASSLALAAARRIDTRAAFALEVAFAWTTIASRDLLSEAERVRSALAKGDLELARSCVAQIVGRDTAHLDGSEIARAAIETLAESACDGIIAPLLALAAGGAPLALAFKAASTLDSILGHIEAPYTYFGRVSARADDIACYLSARVTALAIATAAASVDGDTMGALRSTRNDGRKHRSPNAGLSEAAMAGALGVRLGGTNVYDGVVIDSPHLNASGRAPIASDVLRAMRLVAAATLAVTLATIGTAYAAERLTR